MNSVTELIKRGRGWLAVISIRGMHSTLTAFACSISSFAHTHIYIYILVYEIPVGARFSAPVQTGPGAHPASSTMGTGSLARGEKRLGRGFDHPPQPSAEVKERVELNLYSPSGPSWSVMGWTLLICNLLIWPRSAHSGQGVGHPYHHVYTQCCENHQLI